MLLLARNHSLSKLKPLLSLSLISHSFTTQTPYSNFTSIPKPHFQNPTNSQPLPFSTIFFKPFSSSKSLPLNREGNYDEATTQAHLVCPGCGVHMQDFDPKNPGFFLKPSKKDPRTYRLGAHLEHVAHEPEFNDSLKRGLIIDPENLSPESNLVELKPEKPVVCARCHSLRHYGKVKDPTVENLLPDFDFDHTVGRKLALASGTRSVVLMVVDAADFDGSFPKKVAKLVSDTIEEHSAAWKQGKSGNVPRVVLVVTKIDLLPSSLSPTRLSIGLGQEQGRAEPIIVSLAGPRGNVWAIGSQNAGKSTLINAIGKHVGGKITHLTEAPVPGTTLGIVRVEGVLPGHTKLFDTPGLLNPHQITTRLTREEQSLVNISKELKPRTYRIKDGYSVHIAGLMRLDIEESSVDTVYVTAWASPYLPLHMGKTENACTMVEEHFGLQLQPPIGETRVKELGKWVRKEFHISGNSWDSSSVDIAAAGLGWFAVGLKGEAVLSVWTYDGIDVVLRNALLPNRSYIFEVAGFTVSKIVSKADQASNKPHHRSEKKRKQSDQKESVAC
ncbi:GTP-binding protein BRASSINAZOLE INSENSITIVE PALE GREEN 2 chloroplastic [Prunus yedoensis var. nudiflora]|uniref:GTP-binding protein BRASSINAZOLE INSENSITIVE PALE GREEN 2 chloroplastic n=1 Tax=Prunus yedoensis var. nudiflora TaxID=2094558 RepID=A0A314YXW6_PRUYE|nr:GTP-binding protein BRASSINAZOLE INSENSITIVE PALE GREEN 2 chloroplastic [Prunus yedoensis var. nudiflora]